MKLTTVFSSQKLKRLFSLLAATALVWFAGSSPSQAADPVLKFSRDGKFKIVQFTDTHFTDRNEDLDEAQAKQVGASLLKDMSTILDLEKPDLVVFTGDLVLTSKLEYWTKLVEPMEKKGIPWAAVLGNHDHEKTGQTNPQLMALLEKFPHSLTRSGPEKLGGGGNYILTIKSGTGNQTKAALYFLDSGEYSANWDLLGQYAWIKFDQIAWFREQSAALTKAHGQTPLPALAFFHIPVPEYNESGAQGKIFGQKNEDVCCPKINSGFFSALLESQSILGCFVGHDHVNDTAANVRGICLAYGRKTGNFSYHKLPSGGRVIELTEGQPTFATWIRAGTGNEELRAQWPEDFLPPKPAKPAN